MVALNEEILNVKHHFLCSESESIDSTNPTTRLLVWGNLVRKKFLLLSKFFSNISTPKEPFIWMISWNILILNQLDFYNNDISNLLIIKQVKKKKMRDKSKKKLNVVCETNWDHENPMRRIYTCQTSTMEVFVKIVKG